MRRSHSKRIGNRRPLAERFWAKVNKNGPVHPVLLTRCWLWTGAPTSTGYGQINEGGRGGRMLKAHRVSWELANGPIPDELHVLHHCDNPPCENPAHLFKGTDADNARDRDLKGRCRAGIRYSERAHCKHGHEFTPENTYIRLSGSRDCRECNRQQAREWRRLRVFSCGGYHLASEGAA